MTDIAESIPWLLYFPEAGFVVNNEYMYKYTYVIQTNYMVQHKANLTDRWKYKK